ncbi:hypothetical protein M433DRAFT_138433 [Acidomyces richmondensis BFW]|nr:hypothetical protein M433DRAFT_138433 [Acidomyces richmondensis BFW]
MSPPSMTNGEKPSSKFLSHATSYPIVHDGIEQFKQHPVGRKSLEVADGAYQKFGKPVEPYLETPYSYVKPYVTKADELADSGLNHVDARFPIVKEDTSTLLDKSKKLAFWPYNYVMQTWRAIADEFEKTAKHNDRGYGISTSVMAIVSTELKIASDFFQAVADFLGPKYEEGKKKGADYVRQAEETAEQYKQIGQDKVNEYANIGHQKVDELKSETEKKKDQAKQQTQEAQKKAQK